MKLHIVDVRRIFLNSKNDMNYMCNLLQ